MNDVVEALFKARKRKSVNTVIALDTCAAFAELDEEWWQVSLSREPLLCRQAAEMQLRQRLLRAIFKAMTRAATSCARGRNWPPRFRARRTHGQCILRDRNNSTSVYNAEFVFARARRGVAYLPRTDHGPAPERGKYLTLQRNASVRTGAARSRLFTARRGDGAEIETMQIASPAQYRGRRQHGTQRHFNLKILRRAKEVLFKALAAGKWQRLLPRLAASARRPKQCDNRRSSSNYGRAS